MCIRDRQHNLSPECLSDVKPLDCTVDTLLGREHNTEKLKEKNLSMAANGYCFTRKRQGIFADITQKY